MVNRIPNGSLLTNKLGLLNSLQEYAKVSIYWAYVYGLRCELCYFWLLCVVT